jgi:hypothetical protein
LAGLDSDTWLTSDRALAMGTVEAIERFYERIHAAVVPVTNGSGMKCKLAEAVLAGRAVVTTPLGAAGYPPELRHALATVQSPASISADVVTRAVEAVSDDELRRAWDRRIGRSGAAETYAGVLSAVMS